MTTIATIAAEHGETHKERERHGNAKRHAGDELRTKRPENHDLRQGILHIHVAAGLPPPACHPTMRPDIHTFKLLLLVIATIYTCGNELTKGLSLCQLC